MENNNNKPKNFFKREGFYVILFVCLCIVAVVAVVTIKNNKKVAVNPPTAEQQQIADGNVIESQRPEDASFVKKDNESEKKVAEAENEIEVNISFKKDGTAKDNQTAAVSAGKKTKFINPVEGTLLRAFDKAETDKTNGWNKVNHGIDIAAKLGSPVVAASAGTVEFADIDTNKSLGFTVVVKHDNGLRTVYSNLDKDAKVKVGEKVNQGQEIGKLGDTADAFTNEYYGAHLHFKVLEGTETYKELIAKKDIDQVYKNPDKYVDYKKVKEAKESQDKKVEDKNHE